MVATVATACRGERSTAAVDLSELPQRFINSLGMEMVLIPGGSFEMGRDLDFAPGIGMNDVPRHPVTLSPYYISRAEVTKEQYRRYLLATGEDDLPDSRCGTRQLALRCRWARVLGATPKRSAASIGPNARALGTKQSARAKPRSGNQATNWALGPGTIRVPPSRWHPAIIAAASLPELTTLTRCPLSGGKISR